MSNCNDQKIYNLKIFDVYILNFYRNFNVPKILYERNIHANLEN